MNKRIKELVKQSGAKELGADLYGGEFIGAIRSDFLEKFAVLILKETLLLARVGMEFGPSMDEAVYTYFGVEE